MLFQVEKLSVICLMSFKVPVKNEIGGVIGGNMEWDVNMFPNKVSKIVLEFINRVTIQKLIRGISLPQLGLHQLCLFWFALTCHE